MRDKFQRDLSGAGITLVDWDGQIANPAVKLSISAPCTATFPVTVTVSANGPRLYFGRAANQDATGPRETFQFNDADSVATLYLSIWPDHDGESESYTLSLSGGGVDTKVPIRVVDQDAHRAVLFQITLDYSGDSLGFMSDPRHRQVVERAASDWAYFIDEMHLDGVPFNVQKTDMISVEGYTTPLQWRNVWNAQPYAGFLLYVFGVHSADQAKLRSGGAPSWHAAFQSAGGVTVPGNLRRSGKVDIEVQGNYNARGWISSVNDDDWYRSRNMGSEKNDLLSVVHHEMGHALFFNPAYEYFQAFKAKGQISDQAVVDYFGGSVPINNVDHLNKDDKRNVGAIDPASLLGAFGNEYADNGVMPNRRWITTKLDLLCAQAVGYPLRALSAFESLRIGNGGLKDATVGVPYNDVLVGAGGVPTYYWRLASGALPDGLLLDSFSGTILGTPVRAGSFEFEVTLADIGTIDTTVSQVKRIVVH